MRYRVLLSSHWYPGELNELSGVFVKAQVELLIKHQPQLIMGVVLYGQSDFTLQWRTPLFNGKRLRHYVKAQARPSLTFVHPRLLYLYTPVLTWNPVLLKGNARAVERVVRRQAQKFQYIAQGLDLIHVHSSAAAAPALKAAKYLNVPLLITEHDLWIDERLHPFLRQADEVIAVGHNQAKHLRRLGARHVTVIPNIVDPQRFPLRQHPPEGAIVFSTLARLDHRKGIAELLHAFAVLCQKSARDIRLHIGGEGPCEKAFRHLANALGIAPKVKWFGGIRPEDAAQFLHRSHIFVLASQVESFGLVLAEALACGIPVIATRCGGPEDFVDHRNGRLIEVGNPEQLLAALEYMLENYGAYAPEVLRANLLAYCAPDRVTPQIMAVYERLRAARRAV